MSRLDAWKQALQPVEIQLSVGPALIRPSIRLQDLVVSGQIPIPLLGVIDTLERDAQGAIRAEDVPKMVPLVDAVAMAAFVDPKVTPDGGDDSISIVDVPYEDRILVFTTVVTSVRQLEPFREEQGQPDDASRPGDDLPSTTE